MLAVAAACRQLLVTKLCSGACTAALQVRQPRLTATKLRPGSHTAHSREDPATQPRLTSPRWPSAVIPASPVGCPRPAGCPL